MSGSDVSISIETSCRRGSIALGRGDCFVREVTFDSSARHATVLVSQLQRLIREEGHAPADLAELYVSAGPGSFTGVRVGVTVARTMGQFMPGLRCVAVPSPDAVAWNARELDWQRLIVVLDAREDMVYVTEYERPLGPGAAGRVVMSDEFVRTAARPTMLTGEGLLYHKLAGEGLMLAPAELYYPTAEGVWHAGRALARQGRFVEYRQLLPLYAREPEAVRLWDRKLAT